MKVKVKKVPKQIEETKQVWNFYDSTRLVTINHSMDIKNLDTPFKYYFHKVLIPPIEKDKIASCSQMMDFNQLKEELANFQVTNSIALFYGWSELNATCVKKVIEVCETYISSKYRTLYDFKTITGFLYEYMYYYITEACNPIMNIHEDPISK